MDRVGRVPRGNRKKICINNTDFELAFLVTLQNVPSSQAYLWIIGYGPDEEVKDRFFHFSMIDQLKLNFRKS